MSASDPSPQPSPARGEGAAGGGSPVYAEVIVTGRVQGVGYREFTRRAAERHSVAGFVRNRADGTVEARLVGAAEAIEAMMTELRRGPPHGRVDALRVVSRGQAAAESGFFVTATV